MRHALLHDPKFLALLLRIDHDLAAQTRADGCPCGGALHRADYPRKPRGSAVEVRNDHSSRLSFCCSVCRRRAACDVDVGALPRASCLSRTGADTSGGAAGDGVGR